MMEDLLQYKTDIQVGPGKLLISEPMLQDKSFQKAVIYLCHHDAKESVGYVLNQQSVHCLSDYLIDMDGFYFPLYTGGPVGLDSLHILHSIPELIGGELIADSMYWGGDLERAIELIKQGMITPTNCKFFLGYSGWGEGQLDAELDMNSWLVANSNQDLIFETIPHQLWKTSIASLGARFNPLLYVPLNPELN